jgi:metal-dependent HD superfamily phosphatase/phosphodiesterase
MENKQIQEVLKVKIMWSSVKDEIARDASLRSTDVCR